MSEGNLSADEGGAVRDPTKGWAGKGIRSQLVALLGYFVLALIVTYPAILHFTTGVPGDLLADRDQNLWNLWWLRESLSRGTNPFQTDFLYYPYGADLYYHTLALPLGFIGLLPQILLGLPAAYNTVLLTAFTFSGYGAFRLGLYAIGRRTKIGRRTVDDPRPTTDDGQPAARQWLAAFLGGIVFAFTPYTLDALKGQTEVLSLQWMPLYVEMWLRAMDDGRWTMDDGRRVLSLRGGRRTEMDEGRRWVYASLAGLFLAIAAYSSLYYAVYLVIFTLAHLAYKLLIAWREKAATSSAPSFVLPSQTQDPSFFVPPIVALVALVLTLPLAIGLIADRGNPRLAVTADPPHRLSQSADLLSFFAPPHDHIIFGTWQDQPGVNEPPIHDYSGLGYAALALAIIGSMAGWRGWGTKFWTGLGLLALVLAMGPELQVGRNLTGLPLPFALLQNVPGMDAIAKPERFVVLARLCMGVLATLGAVWLLDRLTKSTSKTTRDLNRKVLSPFLPFAAIFALLLVELPIHPRYMGPYSIPQGFNVLAQQPAGGLMELPFATQQVNIIGQRMLYQTTHDKPIMAGYLSRNYNSPIIDSCGPFWGFISTLDPSKPDIASPLVITRLLDVLNFYDIKYVALYTKSGGPDAAPVDPALETALETIESRVTMSDTLYADDYMSLRKVAPTNLNNSVPSFHIGAGWYPIEQSGGTPFRWVTGGQGALCIFTPRKSTGSLHLEAMAFDREQQITITAGDKQIYSAALPAGAFTSITTPSVEWQPGVTEAKITSDKPGITPNSLDPKSPDERPLTVGVRRAYLAVDAQK
jgi:hypothetical protein